MTATNETLSMATEAQLKRDLPQSIVIPPIRGEMVHLRPATVEDLPRLDELDAFYGASKITGKDAVTERAIVHTWVRRSQAWEAGQAPAESGVGDPESRRTIAWAVLTDADHDDDGQLDAASTDNVIGMIFLIDIDGWSKSARIQIILGMHRIWVSVPEKNSRSISVYQSLGFVPSGTSRDALWDAENNKYQDLIVMDTLADEYDPIRSLDAFGMHLIEDNPGVKEALSAREHSIAIQQNKPEPEPAQRGEAAGATTSDVQSQAQTPAAAQPVEPQAEHHDDTQKNTRHSLEEESNWPYGQAERKPSKEAWWRTLGRGRKRDTESE